MKRYRIRPNSIAEGAIKIIGILATLAMWGMCFGVIV